MRKLVQSLQSSVLGALIVTALAARPALADPVIDGFSRESAPMMSFLHIYGSDLGPAQGSSYVLVGNRGVPIMAWTTNVITILLNPLAYDPTPIALDTAYPVQVVRSDGKRSNIRNLTITSEPAFVNPPGPALPAPPDQPTITGLLGAELCAGEPLVIYGEGFGSSIASGLVVLTVPFKDSEGQPFTQEYAIAALDWGENVIRLLLNLPEGAEPGTYTVTVRRTNGKNDSHTFTVVPCD
jgi:hypothetical protein